MKLRGKQTYQSEEEAAARKLRNQAGTLLVVIGTTILVSYTPLLSIAMLAAFHYNVNVSKHHLMLIESGVFSILGLSNVILQSLNF